jgi:hypothetical protein
MSQQPREEWQFSAARTNVNWGHIKFADFSTVKYYEPSDSDEEDGQEDVDEQGEFPVYANPRGCT